MRFAYPDESGDTGWKIGRGSSEWFVIALLLTDDPQPLHSAIDNLRAELGLPRLTEFRYSKARSAYQDRFLQVLRGHDVTIRAMVVNKRLVQDQPGATRIGDLYHHIVRLALLRHRDVLDETTLVLDERTKAKQVQREVNASLRQALNTGSERPRLREIKHARSLGNNRIQAADMVSGAIYESRARSDDRRPRLIEARVSEIWTWNGEPLEEP